MSSNNFFRSDLYNIHNIIQNSMLVYPKEIIIATLRDFFAKDSYYHYAKDQWGFANTTDHTNLPLGADIPQFKDQQGLSTRIFIGEAYRFDSIYYPAVLVRSGGFRYVPISINRDQGSVQYKTVIFEDGYGNQVFIKQPESFITVGAYEGSVVIDVLTRSLRSRDDIVELISILFTEIAFNFLYDIGITVKPLSVSAPSETEDRNDKLFKQSITLDLRLEWRREIPIDTLIDRILFAVEFQNLNNPDSIPALNLEIVTEVNIVDTILNL